MDSKRIGNVRVRSHKSDPLQVYRSRSAEYKPHTKACTNWCIFCVRIVFRGPVVENLQRIRPVEGNLKDRLFFPAGPTSGLGSKNHFKTSKEEENDKLNPSWRNLSAENMVPLGLHVSAVHVCQHRLKHCPTLVGMENSEPGGCSILIYSEPCLYADPVTDVSVLCVQLFGCCRNKMLMNQQIVWNSGTK